jgi:hypothetical protein
MKILFIDYEKKYVSFLFQSKKFSVFQVSQLSYIIKTVEAFLDINTRLVVLIDGLDVCEQQRVLQILDVNQILYSYLLSFSLIILANSCTFNQRK